MLRSRRAATKCAGLAQLVWPAPQKIHIQRLIEKLDNFRAFINQNDDLQEFILDQQGAKAMPGDLVVDPAAPVPFGVWYWKHDSFLFLMAEIAVNENGAAGRPAHPFDLQG